MWGKRGGRRRINGVRRHVRPRDVGRNSANERQATESGENRSHERETEGEGRKYSRTYESRDGEREKVVKDM